MRSLNVLVVDDEKLIRWSLSKTLQALGHQVFEAHNARTAIAAVAETPPDVVLLDIRMNGVSGFEVLKKVRTDFPRVKVVMISAFGNMDSAVEAMRLGACDYIRKPFEAEEIEMLMTRLANRQELEREVEHHVGRKQRRYDVGSIVGESRAMETVRTLVGTVAASGASSVLVEGESGTGKGLVARVLHYAGRRSKKPFVEVSCTSLTESLVESELFGHEKGAFTDAKATKKGMFEVADGGTLFLDEIGDMPLPAQAKLLRALEERAFKRVGGVTDIHVDIRVVAATNKDLGHEVAEQRFRMDLYYRLAVVRVLVVPLRERPEDVHPLCESFIAHFNREFRRNVTGVEPETLALLQGYQWPGNVRELRNVIERAMILRDARTLSPSDLPVEILGAVDVAPRERSRQSAPSTPVTPEQAEILDALAQVDGNVSKAADVLGVTRDTLRYRMKKYGLAIRKVAKP